MNDIENIIQFGLQLARSSSIDVIMPNDDRYHEARIVYNRMHDYYPAIIVRTLDYNALRTVMAFSFKHNIVLAIRGGGHHIGGFGTCQNGIVIDFSTFRDIKIDIKNKIVSIAPGACLADVDYTLTQNGYILPTGTVSQTGLAGLTLGGGIGWLIGKYGLTCDQLCGADVLLADGRLVKAEAQEHTDLLWGLRGGGGNFGIVTRFRYRLNPLPKTICGMGVFAQKHAVLVINLLVEYLQYCPDSMTIAPVFLKDEDGNLNFRIDFCCANGQLSDVEKLLALTPYIVWSEVREWDFTEWQKTLDSAFTNPRRGYWKASYQEILTPMLVAQLYSAIENSPLSQCTIMFEHLHGAFHTFDQATSAFPLRHTRYGILLSARWKDSIDDQINIDWVRATFNTIDPHNKSSTYSNYTSSDDDRAVNTLISQTLSKISRVKAHYDPLNNFNRNHNVLPTKV